MIQLVGSGTGNKFKGSLILKWVLFGASLATFTSAAQAQAEASNQTALSYILSVDANSMDPASDLGVVDDGIHTYNSIQPGSNAPYTKSVGPGAMASADVSNLTGFELSTLSGYNAVSSSASVAAPSSSALGEVGVDERLTLTDTGPNSITLDLNVDALIEGNANVTMLGAGAGEESYAGVDTFDEANPIQGDTQLVDLNTSAFASPNYVEFGNWVQSGVGAYSDQYSITVNSGQPVGVTLFTDAYSIANTVPAPAGWMTLGVGLTGLAFRRRSLRR